MFVSPTSQRVYYTPGSALAILTTANTFYATPFLVGPYGFTPDQIGIRVSVAGTGVSNFARLGIYEDTPLGATGPGKLLADFGPVGLLTPANAYAIDLKYGLQTPTNFMSPNKAYWLAALFANSGGTQATVAGIGSTVSTFGTGHELGVGSFAAIPSAAAGTCTGVQATLAYGPLPALAPQCAYVATTMPIVGLRHI